MHAADIVTAKLPEPNQLSGLTPWDIDFRQISAGPGGTNIAARFGRKITGLSIEMQSTVHQKGESPPGLVTFGLCVPGTTRKWLGAEAPSDTLVCFGSGREFDAVSTRDFKAITISVDEREFFGLAGDFGFAGAEGGLQQRALDLASLPRHSRLLRNKFSAFFDRPAEVPDAGLEDEIGLAILFATSAGRGPHDDSSQRLRDRSLRRALEIIEARADDPPSIRALCVASGASWPTLYRAFVEQFGIGPKAYLSNLRLNRVRADLLAAEGNARVADIANRWGFWHLGQFANDYRKLFNRRPSDDLRRPH